MSTRGGGVRINLLADATGVKRGVDEAQGHLASFKKTALAGVAGFAIGQGLDRGFAILKDAANAASDLAEQMSKTKVVFGESGSAVLKWSEDSAKAFGVSRREALEAAGVFGNMLVPMGVARREAAGMSESMVRLAGDMASFNNADPKDVLEALRSGLSGESEPLRKFGVFLTAARIEGEAMRLGLAKTTKDVTAAGKAQAAYSLILHDTKSAQGDYARTSTGMANSQRTLGAVWEDLQATLGQKLAPVIAKVAVYLTELVTSAEKNWPRFEASARRAIEPVMPIIRAIGSTLREVAGLITAIAQGDWAAAWKKLKDLAVAFLHQMVEEIKGLGGLMLAAGKGLGQALGDGLVQAFQWSINKIIDGINWTANQINSLNFASGLTGNVPTIGHIGGSTPAGSGAPGGGSNWLSVLSPGAFSPGAARGGALVPTSGSPGVSPGAANGGAFYTIPNGIGGGGVGGGSAGGSNGGGGGSTVSSSGGGGSGNHGPSVQEIVNPALAYARAQLGKRYLYGAGHSLGEFRVYDCSGFATNVAARIRGYTGGIAATPSAYSSSTPAQGNEPVVFGFTNTTVKGIWPGHMGIRLMGTWYQAGDPIHTGGDFPLLRVPAGLGYLAGLSTGSDQVSIGSAIGSGRQDAVSAAQKAKQVIADARTLTRQAIAAYRVNGAPDLGLGDATTQAVGYIEKISGLAERGARSKAETAARASLGANANPSEISARGDLAAKKSEEATVRQELGVIKSAARIVREQIKRIRAQRRLVFLKLRKMPIRNVTGRTALLKTIEALRDKLLAGFADLEGLRVQAEDLGIRLQNLGLDVREAQTLVNETPDTIEPDTSTTADATSSSSVTGGGINPSVGEAAAARAAEDAQTQAQLAQALQRAGVAERGYQLGEQFIRTGRQSQDLGINMTINTLTPGDPGMLRQIAGTIVAALGHQGNLPASAVPVMI